MILGAGGTSKAIAVALKEKNIDVIIDDRKERFGFKMKDAELIGFPYTVIIGKELENGLKKSSVYNED